MAAEGAGNSRLLDDSIWRRSTEFGGGAVECVGCSAAAASTGDTATHAAAVLLGVDKAAGTLATAASSAWFAQLCHKWHASACQNL